MGKYINTGNEVFHSAVKREYIDKTGLIAVVNDTLFSEARFTCVSRCRQSPPCRHQLRQGDEDAHLHHRKSMTTKNNAAILSQDDGKIIRK